MITSDTLAKSTEAAVAAFKSWASVTPSLRGQALFRLSDALEEKSEELTRLLKEARKTDRKKAPTSSVAQVCAERVFWYGGWADKIQQVYSSSNAVAVPFVSQTTVEPAGVVAVFCPKDASLLEFVSGVVPIVAAGNAVVAMAYSVEAPKAIELFLETMDRCDLPRHLIQIHYSESLDDVAKLAGDPNVAAISIQGDCEELRKTIRDEACKTIKYTDTPKLLSEDKLMTGKGQSPYAMLPFVEFKTTWHPAAPLATDGSSY